MDAGCSTIARTNAGSVTGNGASAGFLAALWFGRPGARAPWIAHVRGGAVLRPARIAPRFRCAKRGAPLPWRPAVLLPKTRLRANYALRLRRACGELFECQDSALPRRATVSRRRRHGSVAVGLRIGPTTAGDRWAPPQLLALDDHATEGGLCKFDHGLFVADIGRQSFAELVAPGGCKNYCGWSERKLEEA